jgi:regulatory protein
VSLRYLARREYSRKELMHHLMARSFPVAVIESVLDDLASKELQSDRRYAECYVRSRISKGYGYRRLLEELKQRGIHQDDIPDLADIDWNQSITRVYTKKYGNLPPVTPAERASRERFLRMRGFSSDEIRLLFRTLPSSE